MARRLPVRPALLAGDEDKPVNPMPCSINQINRRLPPTPSRQSVLLLREPKPTSIPARREVRLLCEMLKGGHAICAFLIHLVGSNDDDGSLAPATTCNSPYPNTPSHAQSPLSFNPSNPYT
ncbi:hypothetical protein CPC08DRAFT_715410 [Agrocybe pediades]|nr:hypothetical protein CPC08DRAFT_715410 [Agrocybe pediades]